MGSCEGIREDLVRDLETRAKWRTQMAARYPSEERHPRSAEALGAAAREVAALPDDDERLLHLGDFYCNASDAAVAAYLDRQNALMSHHGFDRREDTTDDLLRALTDAADEALRGG